MRCTLFLKHNLGNFLSPGMLTSIPVMEAPRSKPWPEFQFYSFLSDFFFLICTKLPKDTFSSSVYRRIGIALVEPNEIVQVPVLPTTLTGITPYLGIHALVNIMPGEGQDLFLQQPVVFSSFFSCSEPQLLTDFASSDNPKDEVVPCVIVFKVSRVIMLKERSHCLPPVEGPVFSSRLLH